MSSNVPGLTGQYQLMNYSFVFKIVSNTLSENTFSYFLSL